MLKWATGIVVEYTDHPYFAGTILIGVLFALSGVLVELILSNGLVAGHLWVYAIIAWFLGGLGYVILFAGKLVRGYMRQTDPSI